MRYLAHSENDAGAPGESLRDHLLSVAERARKFASEFGAEDEAYLAGLLHDLGKYSKLFLDRLEGKAKHLDHWSTGAWAALQLYQKRAFGAALAIQGHHIGLQAGDSQSAQDSMYLAELAKRHPLGLTLTEISHQAALDRLQADYLTIPESPVKTHYRPSPSAPRVAVMLDQRMLFSALVDADFIETEAWFEGDSDGTPHHRQAGPLLNAEAAYTYLMRYIENDIRKKSVASSDVNNIRDDLLADCLHSAEASTGLFTLSAPTGAGKTLAMLAFAIRHAMHNPNLRRIIMVIPYLAIIEQTADRYRRIFEPVFGPHYVIEHHSLAGLPKEGGEAGENDPDSTTRRARLLAENWDAPIVVTTSVQCLESLFANRPGSCRKLHRLANSVILFDEVQTLPPNLAVPTLAALSHLSKRYRSTVVFATATQPAFSHLDDNVMDFAPTGWHPNEIVRHPPTLFVRAKRTEIEWEIDPPRTWNEIADEIASNKMRQVLCIVNIKRHARDLAMLLKERDANGIFHLSTLMCPAHRRATLGQVAKSLDAGLPCRLISTQCVEAGVDVDFPVVYRAFAPLDSIAQAAGRCNRNGRMLSSGLVRVFMPRVENDTLYPRGVYQQAASVTQSLLSLDSKLDIQNPETFRRYYTTLYEITGNTDISRELHLALDAWNFPDVARHYNLIPGGGINILVPYERSKYESLLDEARSSPYLNADWVRNARNHTVTVLCGKNDPLHTQLTPVKTLKGEPSDEWFLCEFYDEILGMQRHDASNVFFQ